MIKEHTIQNLINNIENFKKSNLTIAEFCKENNLSKNYFSARIRKIKSEEEPTELMKKAIDLYTTMKKSSIKAETDDRAKIEFVRDEDGKIHHYWYEIYKRDKPSLVGIISRAEMDSIYRMYSFYGTSLTQRQISRFFPDLSLVDFKRVLRAFNITKASAPFAPHMIEEKSQEELREIQLREKENDFLRKAEEDIIRNNEKLLKKYAQENIKLKEELTFLNSIDVKLENINIIDYKPYSTSSKNSINLYLADMHIGSTVTSGSLYSENINYDENEIKRRLSEVIKNLTNFGELNTLNIVLLGDNIDCCGIDGFTSRLDHRMPQQMDAKEQITTFLNVMNWFIHNIKNNIKCNNINVYSVPNGNHSGNYEYAANIALMNLINNSFKDINTTLWDKFYGVFECDSNVFLCCHGKDSNYMKKPMPLNLNDNIQVKIYEYLKEYNITSDKPIHVVKGDLHSESFNSCKLFDYRNVLSLFGSSDYCAYNYSKNSFGVSYDFIINGTVTRGSFEISNPNK